MMRLSKYVAHCGICSRRQATEYIKAGHVKVNGQVEKNPAIEIQSSDVVMFKDEVIKIVEKKVYLLLNKPKNTVTTLKDEKGRRTVIDLVRSKTDERIFPVGRLDRNTTGLLILTNDGDLANRLAHPKYEVRKIYQATLDKELSQNHFDEIKKGFELEDGPVQVDKISYIHNNPKEIGLEIHIGRNRIVRRIFEHFGYHVVKLDRVFYGGLTKKDLPRSFSRHLTEKELIMLRHFKA